MATTKTFTKAQKAAAVLVALGKPRASQLLKRFKKEEIRVLIAAAHSLTAIEQPDLENLVGEFEQDFVRGTGLLDSSEQMDAILTETWTPEEMRALHGDGPEGRDKAYGNIWEVLAETESARIAAFLQTENPQVGAMVISHLSATKSASVLAGLDRESRSAILARTISMRPPVPAAAEMIMARLSKEFARAGGRDEKANQKRVAGILNELDKDATEEALGDLSTTVGDERAAAVRALLFRFDDVPRLNSTSRSIVFDQISSEVLTLALRGAPAEVVEATLSSIGQRTRRMVEADLGRPANGLNPRDVESARRGIVDLVLRLASEGRVTLPSSTDMAA